MAYIFEGIDKPGALDIRLANRPAHLAYLEGLGASIIAGGPLLGDDGKPVGSLIIIDVATLEDAQQFAADDPYGKAGLFASISLRPWIRVFPKA